MSNRRGAFALGLEGVPESAELVRFLNGSPDAMLELAPERVVSFSLDASHSRVAAQMVIESGTPDLDPTHGVIVAGSLYYIANSGWNELAMRTRL